MLEREIRLESRKEVYPDAIIVLGSGLELTRNVPPGLKPSWDERMRLTAAAQLYQEISQKTSPPRIIVTGGEVYQGLGTLAQLAKHELTRRFGISETDILTVDKSLNTLEDIEGAIDIMKKKGMSKAVVISSLYHLVAAKYSKRQEMEFIAAERLLKERHRLYGRIIEDMYDSDHISQLVERQRRLLRILSLPGGNRLYKTKANREKRGVKANRFDPSLLQKTFSPES